VKKEKKSSGEGLRDSQNSIEKKKRPETTTSCGLENLIHQGIPTERDLRQQQVVA
jgi:hypothetical protein